MEAVHSKYKHNQKKKNRKSKVKDIDPESPELEKLLSPVEDIADNFTSLQVSDLDEATCSRSECVDNVESEIFEAFHDISEHSNDFSGYSKKTNVDIVKDDFEENKKKVVEQNEVDSESWKLMKEKKKMGYDNVVKQYLQSNKDMLSESASATELDEMQVSSFSGQNNNDARILIDTKFESPEHISKGRIYPLLSDEDEDDVDIEKGLEALQIADVVYEVVNEASAPSAPVIDSVHTNINNTNLNLSNQNINENMNYTQSKSTESQDKYLSDLFMSYKKEQMSSIKPFTEAQLASLYNNSELCCLQNVISEFIEHELRGSSMICSQLYEMLISYLRARGKLSSNNMELDVLKSECKEFQHQLWSFETVTVSEAGECQDGNPVNASYDYKISRFDKQASGRLSKGLLSIRELVNESYSLNAYTCQVLRLQIDHYIQTIILDFSFLPQNAPVSLVQEGLPPFGNHTSRELLNVINELRVAISVLFSFQRRQIKDEGFVNDTRHWLSRLVAVLLRVATWKDHIYLLNHILRCPAGVGKWAASFIQSPMPSPNSPFSIAHLDHLITTVASLLLPINERDQFLMQWSNNSSIEGESLWVVVDSDGEDVQDTDGACHNMLRESDIVDMFNQIPFDAIFRQVLHIKQKDNQDEYDNTLLSDHKILKLFAFSTVLLNLFEKGLTTYSGIKYKQFSKRLGRLVRHTTQYCTDQFQTFQTECVATIRECDRDLAMLERLHVEYDALFMRAVRILHDSPGHVAWQFLAVLPFSHISSNMLWEIFFYLLQYDCQHVTDNDDNIDESQLPQQSQQKSQSQERLLDLLSELFDAEVYYLLTTITNMALGRSQHDWPFIQAATLHLLQIGFLNEGTRDTCSKSARIMLTNLTNKYPMLISVIVDKFKTSQCGNLSLYLMKELPVFAWRPNEKDLTVLADWLLYYPLNSSENSLARYLLSHLNWGFCSGDTQELFLPWSMHCRVGLLVARAAAMYASETTNSSGSAVITESVKQMSLIATSMVRSQANEQAFSVWVWQIMFRLRLHLMDQSETFVWNAMANPAQAFTSLPDLDSQSEEMELLRDLVKQQESLSVLAALLMTTVGHSVPIIYSDGFSLMLKLQACYRHTAVIFALQHIVPLFLDCPQSLLSSENFRTVVLNLLSADRTYLKMARNLIAPEFPGMILKQFGDMIQYHLEHYRRFSLATPAPLAQLWLQVLCSVWAEEATSIVYLMDIVLRVAFFRSEVKIAASDILSQLLQSNINSSQSAAGSGRLLSLLSWVSSSSPVYTLLPKAAVSCPHAPWFAYFALELEEFNIQNKNGLWKAILKELAAATGKASVDNAIKRAANTLKIPVIPSAALSIYRWSQQALDTPVDHPVLPLIWQKFYSLYLARVPSASGVPDRGCVGEKFFEGMTNLSYLKRLKKKLAECYEYHKNRAVDSDKFTLEQKAKADNLARLYRTFSLWLEEPRLQEPGLFLPGLPPQYNPLLLTALISGEQSPWLEFVDQDVLNKSVQDSLRCWMACQNRLTNDSSNTIRTPQQHEERNPVKRILKRLQSYDTVLPPPSLKFGPPVVPPITRDVILHKGVMLDSIRPSVSALLRFAKTYSLRVSEHTALDCTFLELLPTLFRDVETEIVLHAACDTAEPGTNPRRSHNTANSLVCAGPAEIRIKILEARLNEGSEHEMQTNRLEMEGLLRCALQPPPQILCVASVHLEQLTQALEREAGELSRLGDIELLTNVKGCGVSLFYHLTRIFTDDTSLYPPVKQLLTTCIETLGQTFIAGEESECRQLLSTVLQVPQLTGLLAPHFTPSVAMPSTFINIYANLVSITESSSASSDLTFVLLTKIDLSRWMLSVRPKLCERSQLIELTVKALTYTGKSPDENKLILHEVYRKHLCQLLMFDFPEHYGEVLVLTLKQSETQSIAPDVWFELLEALTSCKFRQNMSLGQMKEEIRKFATEQKVLTHVELRDTVKLLADHFTKERLQYGLYGLYPKYRDYIEAFTALLGTIGHAVVAARLHNDRGSLGDKLSEQLWPCLASLFSPWLTPYFTRNLSEPTAAWIQQLTDDRSVLPPWIVTDGGHANKMACMFIECVRFMLDTLPGCSNILSFVWQFYVVNYAHSSVKDYILNLIHGRLLTLPWNRFTPSFQDIDLMLRVVDQYVPYCHTFLGAIFIEIPWYMLVKHVSTNCPVTVASKTHSALLHLLIKLSNEPNIRQSGKVTPLLLESQQFLWHLVDASSYELVTNWFVMSYDPRVILQLPNEEWNGIDMAALELLQVAAGHVGNAPQYHPSTPKKRQIFVRATVKLLLSCLSRYKPLVTSRYNDVKTAIRKMIDKIEAAFISSVPGPQRASEAGLLLSELLVLVNQAPGSNVATITVEAITDWLSTRDCSSVVIPGLLRVLTTTVQDEIALGTLMEATLTAFFRRRGSLVEYVSDGDGAVTVSGGSTSVDWWFSVISVMQPAVPRQVILEESLVNNGHLLTLYALIMKALPASSLLSSTTSSTDVSPDDIRNEAIMLNKLVEWIGAVKPIDQIEPKVILLLCKAVHLCYRQCNLTDDPSAAVPSLNRLVSIVNRFAEQRTGAWNLLGAIGIRKQPTISNRFRLLCRAVAALILAQLPERKSAPELATPIVRLKENAPGSIALSSNTDDIVPNAEAVKAMSTLESLTMDKSYADIKDICSIAISQVLLPDTSLHNSHEIISSLAAMLYSDTFLYMHTK
ncbi:ectopic P-granules autophagy protein 5 isoform X2 [Lycorma delicatula]|uniref:ectopic P-granules autophagy protein 5 isoform X2 n=1 Tax=Lycorma delicatula TaxID=130591 RepID=UPI003F516445